MAFTLGAAGAAHTSSIDRSMYKIIHVCTRRQDGADQTYFSPVRVLPSQPRRIHGAQGLLRRQSSKRRSFR